MTRSHRHVIGATHSAFIVLWLCLGATDASGSGNAPYANASIPSPMSCAQKFADIHDLLISYGYCENTALLQAHFPTQSGVCDVRRAEDILSGMFLSRHQASTADFHVNGCRVDRRASYLMDAVMDQGPKPGETAWLCQNVHSTVNIRDKPTTSGSTIIAKVDQPTRVMIEARVFNPQQSHHWYRVSLTSGGVNDGYVYHTSVENSCQKPQWPTRRVDLQNHPYGWGPPVHNSEPPQVRAQVAAQSAPATATKANQAATTWRHCGTASSGQSDINQVIGSIESAYLNSNADRLLRDIDLLCGLDSSMVDADILYLEAWAALEMNDIRRAYGAFGAATASMNPNGIFADDLKDLGIRVDSAWATLQRALVAAETAARIAEIEPRIAELEYWLRTHRAQVAKMTEELSYLRSQQLPLDRQRYSDVKRRVENRCYYQSSGTESQRRNLRQHCLRNNSEYKDASYVRDDTLNRIDFLAGYITTVSGSVTAAFNDLEKNAEYKALKEEISTLRAQ